MKALLTLRFSLMATLLTVLAWSYPASAGPGSVDGSFIPPAPNGWVHDIAVQPDGKILVAGEFTTIGGVMRANPDYVCWFLNSALGRQQVDAISRQIMQNNINSEEIRTLRIPLPSLEVQRKLVERVAAARAEMARERAAAAALRQSIAAEIEFCILGANA